MSQADVKISRADVMRSGEDLRLGGDSAIRFVPKGFHTAVRWLNRIHYRQEEAGGYFNGHDGGAA